MSEKQVTRLHPITIVLNFIQQIKSFLIPIIIVLLGQGMKFTVDPKHEDFYATLITLGVGLIFIASAVTIAIVKWRKFIYWFEAGELRIEYGFFVKKKRYIPFERIQTLNYKEGIFHRPFKLVKVEIETAGGNSSKAEAVLTAITREQADQIELEMKNINQKVVTTDDAGVEVEIVEAPEPEKKEIYRMSRKDLILLASTSSSMGILFSAIAAVASQFSDLIPYEEIYGEFQNIARFGVLVIVILVLAIVLLSWIVAVAISFVINYDFKLELQDKKLLISKGLLEKKRITVPMHRVQGIRIIENPLRQLFGYCRVVIESAGGSGDEREDSVVILPFTKKTETIILLQKLFPEYNWQQSYRKVPKKALLRYLLKPLYFWTIPITACSIYFYPYGMLSLIILPIVVLLAYAQYRTAGFAIEKLQLTLVYRGFSKTTFVTSKKRVQSMSLKQSFFAERNDIATNEVHIISGNNGLIAQTKHFDLTDMEDMMAWYKPNK